MRASESINQLRAGNECNVEGHTQCSHISCAFVNATSSRSCSVSSGSG